jgi:hypothetical protein
MRFRPAVKFLLHTQYARGFVTLKRLVRLSHLKSAVYQTRPTNLAQLKTQIEENLAKIPENTLRRAMQDLQNRLTECVQRNGQHLTDVIFKK